MKPKTYLTVRESVAHFIDAQQPPMHLSCDDLNDPLKFGLLIFPRFIYEKMNALKTEELQNGVIDRTS